MVVSVQLKTIVNLQRLNFTSFSVFYEAEIFPAALIKKWSPIHIAVFRNGHCILTGVKNFVQVEDVMNDLLIFLRNKCLL